MVKGMEGFPEQHFDNIDISMGLITVGGRRYSKKVRFRASCALSPLTATL